MMKARLVRGLVAGVVIGLMLVVCSVNAQEASSLPEIPEVTLRFTHSAFVDHTDASIALAKGWFKEVGITIEDPEWNVTFPKIGSVLAAGTVDVATYHVYAMTQVLPKAPNLRMFVYGDLFLGFAIMGQPGYKRYVDFRAEGFGPQEALKRTIEQTLDKRWALSPGPAARAFLGGVLDMVGHSLEEIDAVTVEEPIGVAMMESKRAQFSMGGGPQRATLESKGHIAILTNVDVLEGAPLGETRGVHQNGWATTTEYWKQNRDTILRLASVKWRIMKFINEHPYEALEIHMPFLNKISGHKMTVETGKAVYDSIDPFFTFESQYGWFFDPENRFYHKYPIRAAIANFESKGVIPQGSVDENKVSIAEEVYTLALQYRDKTDKELYKAESAIRLAEIMNRDVSQARRFLKGARHYYEIYDFLDALKFAQASREWAEYALH